MVGSITISGRVFGMHARTRARGRLSVALVMPAGLLIALFAAAGGTFLVGTNAALAAPLRESRPTALSFAAPPVPAACTTAPFTDVGTSDTFCPEINWLKENAITNGYGDGTYHPQAFITRMAVAAFLARLSGDSLGVCATEPFTDVPITHPFCPEIQWMKDNNISTGFGDGSFRPGNFITRMAISAFLPRFAGASLSPCSVPPFNDVPVDHPFCKEITWMADNEITTGFGDGGYHPEDNVTRQSAAAFVYRMAALQNAAPVVTTSGGSAAYTEGGSAVVIDGSLTVTDADDTNLESAQVSITSGFQSGDSLNFVDTAFITGNYDTGTGVLTLTGTDSVANYQAALQSITFTTANVTPVASKTVEFKVYDGTEYSNAPTKEIVVTPSNDAPELNNIEGGSLAYAENDPATQVTATTTVLDADSADFDTGTLTVDYTTGGTVDDRLEIANQGTGPTQIGVSGATVSYEGTAIGTFTGGSGTTPLVVTLNSAADVEATQALVRAVTYRNVSDNPSTAARTVRFVLTDGDGGTSSPATRGIALTAVNDGPVNSVPGAQSTNEDTAKVFSSGNGNQISVSDVDVGGSSLQVTLGVTNGTLTLSGISGLSFSFSDANGTGSGDGTADAAMTFRGSQADVNTAMNGMTFNPTLNFPGAAASGIAAFSITSNDLGNTGSGGALTDTDGFDITVNQVNDAPVGGTDSGETIGNVQLFYDSTPGAGVPGTTKAIAGNGVLANDSDPVEGSNVSVTGIVGCGDVTAPFVCPASTTGGGDVTLNADGSFVYTPDDGETTADSFQYVLTDDGTPSPASSNVTVNLTFVGNRIWFVKNNATPGGFGRSNDPFDTLVEAQTAATVAGDRVFVYFGDGTTNNQNAGFAFAAASQTLQGEAIALTTGATVNGDNNATLVAAGSQPLIGNSAGNGVTMGIGSTVTGLSIAGSANAIDLTTAGAATATHRIISNTIRGAGAEGIDININAGTSGTPVVVITDNTWNTAGTHTGNAIDISHAAGAGTLSLDVSSNVNVVSAGKGILIAGGAVASTTVNVFANNTIHGNTVGNGVEINNVTFDAISGGGIQQVDADNLFIGASGNPVGGAGLSITTTQGSLFFDDLDVFSAAGTALALTGSGSGLTFNVTPITTTGSSTLDADNGKAVDITSATIDLRLADLDSDGAAAGVNFNTVGGQFSTPSGSSITKASGAGTAFSVASSVSGATFAYGGTLNVTSGSGVSLTTNTGSTISFTGDIDLNTGASAAFAATGGGTVNVAGSSNTLTTTTATALNISDTTIGASGVNFLSINVDGNDSAPTNGILLDTTGATAGLTVAGTGSAGTGGTIQDTSGNGIELIGTRAPSLSWMTVTSNLGNGIHGGDGTAGGVVTNATLADLVVSNNGNDSGTEDGILFQGLVGTATWSDLNVSGSSRHNAAVINNTGTLTSLAISGSNFHDNSATGSNGLEFIADGTATMTVTVGTTNFSNNHTNGVLGQTLTSGTLTLTVTGGSYTNNFIGVEFTHASSGNLTGTFTGGNITNTNACTNGASACGAPVNIFLSNAATGAGILRATVTSNVINNGGSANAPGVWVHTGTPVVGHIRALITGNNISSVQSTGIDVGGGGCTGVQVCNATIDATIENNTVATSGALALAAITLSGATNTSDTIDFCVDIENNNASSTVADGIRVRHRQNSTVRMPGYIGTQYDTAAVISYIDGRNPATTDTITATSSGTGTGFTNGTCATP
jgi:hypothetical protein